MDEQVNVTVKNANGNEVKANENKLTVTDKTEPVVPPTPGEKEVLKSILNIEKEYLSLKLNTLMIGEYDSNNAILEIHAGAVELFIKKNATLRYSTIENWSRNMYNLNTKRAIVDEKFNCSGVNI